ncbi:Sterol regulatory element-binding protein cleavage-activating protein [Trichinella pseudospiralis]|uniref:Sterol regulatory element-binding protein cleavage-activating protein n=1 Tax=Trichinella pseudospiralis TaxID=6337 RepID=A0A0V0XXY4_TRIPS|nr:Sterol regulatory element-binding protein cleavage-activating protein [Trichinella pseudospiralis]
MQRKGGMVRRRWQILERRVTHAYYKYGRFCSSHPFATLITSLSMALLLSYPLSRVRWFYPSPCVLVKTRGWPASPQPDELTWLYQKYPVAQILQIVVRLHDDSNGADMIDVVRGFYSTAFELDDQIKALLPNSSKEQETCHEQSAAGLLVLSPTGIWCHNRRLFFMDRHFLEQIKTTRSCKFDLLYGVPKSIRLSSYALTIIADQNTTDFLIQLRNQFSTPDAGESAADLIHVQYKIKKTWMDYMLLFVSYIILLLYLYVCAQKIEMVKSKWALAFGAGCTVAFSLLMAAGICSHFSLIRRTWLVELFPYLALIVGVENTLCITRSVVSTPVHLEVNIRLARGLASEGWSITKNFLIGFCILAVGFCSDVPEISEFCTVALVGFVVDFYMQLFFYVPCLTFDLARFGPKDKLRLSRAQFDETNIIQNYPEDHYPPVCCPFKHAFKSLLPTAFNALFEYYSLNECLKDADTNVNINADANSRTDFLHRIPIPHCLEQLLRRNRPRYFQRFFMLAISAWIVWFAVGIHRCFNPSESLPSKLPEEKPHWELFHCWAELMESKGVTVSRRFVTILPAVELQARVNRSLVQTVRRQARDAQPLIVENCTEMKAVQLHQMTITCMTVCNWLLVTASMDQTLKVCDLNTGCVEFSMLRHNSPVISVAVDRLTDMFVYSCCMDGVICAWNLCKLGRLVWIQRDCVGCSAEIALALTGKFLVGYSLSEIIWIWDKYDGLLISQIKPSLEKFIPFCLDIPQIVVLDDGLIAVNQKQSIQLWDLEKKMMLRQVDLDNQMDRIHDLQRLGEHALLCFISDVIYRVDFPIIKSFMTIQSSSTMNSRNL